MPVPMIFRRSARAAVLGVSLVVCATSGTACASDDAAPVDLRDRTFESTSVTGHDLVPGSRIEWAFEGDTMAVRAGCNTQTGPWEQDGDTVRWTRGAGMTMMACPDELMAQDTWLGELFTAGVTVSRDGDDVVATSADVRITFTPR